MALTLDYNAQEYDSQENRDKKPVFFNFRGFQSIETKKSSSRARLSLQIKDRHAAAAG